MTIATEGFCTSLEAVINKETARETIAYFGIQLARPEQINGVLIV